MSAEAEGKLDSINSTGGMDKKKNYILIGCILFAFIVIGLLLWGASKLNILSFGLPNIKSNSPNAVSGVTLDKPKQVDLTGVSANSTASVSTDKKCYDSKIDNGVMKSVEIQCITLTGQGAANKSTTVNTAASAAQTSPDSFNRFNVSVLLNDGVSASVASATGTNTKAPDYSQNGGFKPLDTNEVIGSYLDRIKSTVSGKPEPGEGSGASAIAGRLVSSKTAVVYPTKLPDANFLFMKGAGFFCTLDGAILATTAGETTCVVKNDVFSANRKVLLFEKGSTVILEYFAVSAQGQNLINVVASSIRTPTFIDIPLDSFAHGRLGETGLNGQINNRWGERLGAAMMVAAVGDLVRLETARLSQSSSAATVMLANGQTTQSISAIPNKILDSTINIKASIYKNQGETINITAARDIDFSNVYALKRKDE